MYKKEPWTLNSNNLKKEKKNSKKVLEEGKVKFFTEDEAVSTAKVMKLFEKDKNKIYTNKEISEKLGISEGTVSGITNRLEQLSNIKIVKVKQSVSALSQMFQHKDGSLHAVEKIKNKKDTAKVVKELFEEDKNRVFTKKEIVSILTNKGESESQIDTSLKILLLDGTLKLTGINEYGRAEYQHIEGNKKGAIVRSEINDNYTSLKEFLQKNSALDKKSFFENKLKKRECMFFYSSSGIIPVWPIKELEKILKNNKSIIKKILTNYSSTLENKC